MIIHPVQTEKKGRIFRLSVDVELEKSRTEKPQKLWYEFPLEYKDQLSINGNGFLLPLVALAMELQENIDIRNYVSPLLIYNAREYQRMLHFWRPEKYKEVDIFYKGFIEEDRINYKEGGAMSSFSGGVDSSFTVYSHSFPHEKDPALAIKYALYIGGFDHLEDEQTRKEKIEAFSTLLKKKDITLIPVHTNIRSFYDRKVSFVYCTMVVGTAYFFDTLVSRFYFSEDNTYDFPVPFGVNPLICSRLSTESMDIVSFGASVSKIEKIKTITEWKEMHNLLVVCHENPNGLKNCGHCMKCLLTMTALEMAGVRHFYKTFPANISYRAIMKLRFIKDHYCFPRKWIQFAREKKSNKILFCFIYALMVSRIKAVLSWRV